MSILQTIINPNNIFVQYGTQSFKAAVGYNDIINAQGKIEGDGKTPIGHHRVLYGFYRPDRVMPPVSKITLKPITSDMGWCDEPHHPNYNTLIQKPFNASHEDMWREDPLYDIVLITDYNMDNPIPGKGSAIFIHCTNGADDTRGSAGCLKLHKNDLLYILETCDEELIWVVN